MESEQCHLSNLRSSTMLVLAVRHALRKADDLTEQADDRHSANRPKCNMRILTSLLMATGCIRKEFSDPPLAKIYARRLLVTCDAKEAAMQRKLSQMRLNNAGVLD